MSGTVLILRPAPGAEATAARVRAAGLVPLLHPLFEIRPVAWSLPTTPATALLLTSANAVRLARVEGEAPPDALTRLPVFAVGEATARAAEAAGLTVAWTGDRDGAAALRALAGAGHRAAWHLRGRDARALPAELLRAVRLTPVTTYAAEPTDGPLPTLPAGTVALLHSPRAAARLAELVAPARRANLAVVAISAAAARSAGAGWRSVEVAKRPTDAAMLDRAADWARPPGVPRHR